jgi:hypothetical protein
MAFQEPENCCATPNSAFCSGGRML